MIAARCHDLLNQDHTILQVNTLIATSLAEYFARRSIEFLMARDDTPGVTTGTTSAQTRWLIFS